MVIIVIAVNNQGGRHVTLVNHVGVPWNVNSVDQSTDPILMLKADIERESGCI